MNMRMLLGTMGIVYCGMSSAATSEGYITDYGINIKPVIDAGIKYDDNIFNENSETTGSSIFTVAPAVTFSLDDGINNYNFDIGIESGTYLDSSDDNYLTGNVGFNSHLEASSRSRFDIQLEVKKEVEVRGTGITEGAAELIDEPLTYNDQLAQLTYEYGALSSKGRIAITGEYYDKNYTNYTDVTEFRSYNEPALSTTFFYSTNANTDAFIEVKGSTMSYDKFESISRDSDVISASLGIKWELTALTSGSFKIGQTQKNFTDNARKDLKVLVGMERLTGNL